MICPFFHCLSFLLLPSPPLFCICIPIVYLIYLNFSSFYYRVAQQGSVNKMDPHNLAIIFAPTLLQDSSSANPDQLLKMMPKQTKYALIGSGTTFEINFLNRVSKTFVALVVHVTCRIIIHTDIILFCFSEL